VENTTEAWYEAIKFHIENLGALKEAAVANQEQARAQFGIDENVGELVKLFERIIEEDK
jgi:hypothetical protein